MTPDATAARLAPGASGRVALRSPRPLVHGRRHRRPVLAALALVTTLLVAGCGVRLETPEPTEPSPDVHEVVRRAAVDDALAVEDLAAAVAPTVTDPTVLAALDEAGRFAEQHVQALGGVYESGLPVPTETDGESSPEPVEVTTSPAPGEGDDEGPDDPAGDGSQDAPVTGDGTADGTSTAAPTTDDVVTALVGAAQRTRASADLTQDAELARLLASVAASEHVSAQRLAAATGSEAATDLDVAVVPVEDTPSGVGAADLATLVAAEDAAGYALEVRGAQVDGDVRTAAVARAAEHRARAQAWALAAGTDGTDQDPRRTAYVLPDGEDVTTLARRLETELTASYASLVATAAPESRGDALALLTDSWLAALAWGAAPVAFPGMPEQQPAS
ncbi:DUF4439 domain-containing protein [Cellulosimicrobium sp. Marseille-Q4280]|uniref:DUF4439 domain-containing protein n=1 Tax=Cellulosimicrobium sp. Marseille-Q4280 TaxID=2937992 RepID=UPI00203D623E|nr:DUF4439 domain-containing protein [Cellulosimicrobium sp. Marseille-Q4280]